jgi:peptidyl-prolyl cis-trans isomerase C
VNLRDLGFPQRFLLGVLGTLLVPVVTVGLLVLVVSRLTELPQGVAMRVSGVDVTEQRLQQRMDAMDALYGIRPPKDGPALDGFVRQSAKAVAVSMVIEQAATQRGIVVPDADAQEAVNQLIAKRFGPNGRDAFISLLGETGASMQNVLDEVKRQRAFGELVSRVTGTVPNPTEAEARAAYDSHRSTMVLPQQRRLSNIVFDSEDDATAALQRAQGGADFAQLARDLSTDQQTRDDAGDLGYLTREQLQEPYAQDAFTAPLGALFGPVQTGAGWNVGKVVEIRPEVPLSFEQVQEELRNGLRGERQTKVWNDWLADRLREADLRYATTYEPADPDGLPSGPADPGPPSDQLAEPR